MNQERGRGNITSNPRAPPRTLHRDPPRLIESDRILPQLDLLHIIIVVVIIEPSSTPHPTKCCLATSKREGGRSDSGAENRDVLRCAEGCKVSDDLARWGLRGCWDWWWRGFGTGWCIW